MSTAEDLGKLILLNQPPRENIARAEKTLRMLGCIGNNGEVTPIGEEAAHCLRQKM